MLKGMIFPIGQYQGATDDGGHEVRRGGSTERLDDPGFAAWGLGHGPVDPVLAAGVSWTRKELVKYAEMAGLAEAGQVVGGLVERELLTEAPTNGAKALAFARAHRTVPLAVGLGNTPDAPHQFTIGLFDRGLVQTDEVRYDVWCWSAVYDSLWQVCQARAAAAEDATQADNGEKSDELDRTDPARVLRHFLTGLHQLASANTLYLDVVAP